jgi:GDPmannose 4,6-dehydratase
MRQTIIFGVKGQDGYYLQELLQKQGHQVVGVCRSAGGDVSNRSYVEALIKDVRPNYVFHLAANSTTRHEALFENHETISTGALNILESVKLHCPACRVFITGSGVQFVNRGVPISEYDNFAPTSAYAVSRIHSVYAARYYRSLGIKAYVGYLFHHESPLRKPEHLCKKIADLAKRVKAGSREQLALGDSSVQKEVGFAGDIAAGILTLVSQEAVFEATIGTGKAYSIQEWIEACFSRIGVDWQNHTTFRTDGFVPEYPILVSDPTTIFSLGWQPAVDMHTLVGMMLE